MRQSGRTTRILQEANEAKKRGEKVLIVAPNTRIQDHLVMMARRMSLLVPNGALERQRDFTVARDFIKGRYRGFRGSVFADHTVAEMLSGKDATKYAREIDMMQLVQTPTEPMPPRWTFRPF